MFQGLRECNYLDLQPESTENFGVEEQELNNIHEKSEDNQQPKKKVHAKKQKTKNKQNQDSYVRFEPATSGMRAKCLANLAITLYCKNRKL